MMRGIAANRFPVKEILSWTFKDDDVDINATLHTTKKQSLYFSPKLMFAYQAEQLILQRIHSEF